VIEDQKHVDIMLNFSPYEQGEEKYRMVRKVIGSSAGMGRDLGGSGSGGGSVGSSRCRPNNVQVENQQDHLGSYRSCRIGGDPAEVLT
jgi:hypothetical protein